MTGEKITPGTIRKRDYHDFAACRASLDITESGGRPAPDSTFFCLDTDGSIFVDAVSIRRALNEGLLKDGGHIGAGLRPSERDKGLGTRLIALALEECGRLGLRDALMCCGKDNAASARTIVKNGGGRRNRPTMLDSSISKRSFHDERSFFPCRDCAQSVRTNSLFHIRSPHAHAKSIRLRGAPSQDGKTPRFFIP